ncbi:hypothetical protein CU669_19915 [Paramagnetospirillum kuznetsovii]|uniref:Uncharacterized protein n=1 Tax=Paramagnetospirillum kuznetsovii TaxID=2053833 RepID=A0A364NSV9_9PROT|nr:hypothetical protein [Paramagnetospirillum kuznetsovii]RAU20158.1 hypothetical protein CU669_19915 [Paramagnetospirillum kuznetsovii]
MTDRYKYIVPRLMAELIHCDEFLDSIAIAAIDFLDDAARRKEFAAILRSREAIRIAPRIYGWQDPFGALMLSQYGRSGWPKMPAPHLVAGAMARQYGWRLAVPTEIAKHVLGLVERPVVLHKIPFDQNQTRQYAKAKLTLVPSPADLLFLSPAGQCLRQGLPHDASAPGLVEIGEQAGGAAISAPAFLNWLREDLADGRLNEREVMVAEAIIANAGNISLRAPREFNPPPAEDEVAALDGWWQFEENGLVCLAARHIRNHPYLENDGKIKRTSPVIWLDERLGFARTRSRLYRLGKKEGRS